MGVLSKSILDAENLVKQNLDKQENLTQVFSKYLTASRNGFPEFIKAGYLDLISNKGVKAPFLLPFISENGYLIESSNNQAWCQRVESLLFNVFQNSTKGSVDVDIIDLKSFGLNFENIIKLDKQNINVKITSDISGAKARISKLREIAFDYKNDISPYTDFHSHIEAEKTFLKKLNVVVINGVSSLLNNVNSGSIDQLEALVIKANLLGFFFILVNEENVQIKGTQLDVFKEHLFNVRDNFNNSSFQTVWEFDLTADNYVKAINDKYKTSEAKVSSSYLNGIEVKVGKSSGNDFSLKIGPNAGDGGAYHAIVGGQSGKGKSNFLKTFILNSLKKYDKTELQFIILDCKGMGFPEYKTERPSNVIDYESSANLDVLITKLESLDKEFEKRRNLFKEHGEADIEKLFTNKKVKVPRVVCIIDEFQVLYSEIRKAKIVNAILVDKILLTGRAMGIHLIFATQGLSGNVDTSIVQNIPIRIIFGVVEMQSMRLLGNSAATNLPVGKAIVNYNNGQKEDNISLTTEKL